VKVGVQDYYRTINAAVVLQQHPQLKSLHVLLESTSCISDTITKLQGMLQDTYVEEVEESPHEDEEEHKQQQQRFLSSENGKVETPASVAGTEQCSQSASSTQSTLEQLHTTQRCSNTSTNTARLGEGGDERKYDGEIAQVVYSSVGDVSLSGNSLQEQGETKDTEKEVSSHNSALSEDGAAAAAALQNGATCDGEMETSKEEEEKEVARDHKNNDHDDGDNSNDDGGSEVSV
jgi:hypothetical protein